MNEKSRDNSFSSLPISQFAFLRVPSKWKFWSCRWSSQTGNIYCLPNEVLHSFLTPDFSVAVTDYQEKTRLTQLGSRVHSTGLQFHGLDMLIQFYPFSRICGNHSQRRGCGYSISEPGQQQREKLHILTVLTFGLMYLWAEPQSWGLIKDNCSLRRLQDMSCEPAVLQYWVRSNLECTQNEISTKF